MARIYWIIGAIGVGGAIFFGILWYGVSVGRAKCQAEQSQAVQTVNTQTQAAQNTINSASLDAVHTILCKTARDGCKARTGNTSTGM